MQQHCVLSGEAVLQVHGLLSSGIHHFGIICDGVLSSFKGSHPFLKGLSKGYYPF